jgi:hypothetical protein
MLINHGREQLNIKVSYIVSEVRLPQPTHPIPINRVLGTGGSTGNHSVRL